MTKKATITIPAEQLDAFGKFVDTAGHLYSAGHLHFVVENNYLLEQDIQSLLGYQILVSEAKKDKSPITLQPEDIESLAALKYVMTHFSKPMQAPLLGETLYKNTVSAKDYLEKLLPPERGL